MSLTWPWALLTLAAFPALLGVRWWLRRRRRRNVLRLSSLTLIRSALPQRSAWQRRIPLALFALALVALSVAGARPRATVVVPAQSSAILLVIDVSSSMCSSDVPPNRLTAAEGAASDFVKAQRDGARIGVVVFSGIAAVLVPPTSDKDKLLAAIGTLRTSRGTAIGLGILAAIDAIAQVNPEVPASGVQLSAEDGPPPGAGFQPDTIVLLTDGYASTRSASVPPGRPRSSAPPTRSAGTPASAGRAAATGAPAAAGAVSRSTRRRSPRWPPPPAASTTRPPTPRN
jgi:Ca-activated chloride channel family protein